VEREWPTDCSCGILEVDANGPSKWATDPECPEHGTDIHTFFELSYANYLVLHRSVLQSMPTRWQVRFVKMLEEMAVALVEAGIEVPDQCEVIWRDENNKVVLDPIPHYNRGRTTLFGEPS
jgi:hypothetical protein